jgi:hypothetical protein
MTSGIVSSWFDERSDKVSQILAIRNTKGNQCLWIDQYSADTSDSFEHLRCFADRHAGKGGKIQCVTRSRVHRSQSIPAFDPCGCMEDFTRQSVDPHLTQGNICRLQDVGQERTRHRPEQFDMV